MECNASCHGHVIDFEFTADAGFVFPSVNAVLSQGHASCLARTAPVQDVVERGEAFTGNFYPLYVSLHPARHRRKCVSILVVLYVLVRSLG